MPIINNKLNRSLALGLWSTVYPLLLRGADANAQDAHGYTALHHAVYELDKIGYKKSPSYASYKTVIEILLQSNANRQIKSSAGLLASDMAKDSGNFKILNQYLQIDEKKKHFNN